jgi:hypothetical protein
MQTIVSSLKKFLVWFSKSLIGLVFIAALLCAVYKPAHAKEPTYGHPVQRVTLDGITCTRVRSNEVINFLISSSRESNLTYKKVASCVELVKKSKFILVGSNELDLTARIAASFQDIKCLKAGKFVVSFSGDVPFDLESKIESCFITAKKIYDYKNNSLSWI